MICRETAGCDWMNCVFIIRSDRSEPDGTTQSLFIFLMYRLVRRAEIRMMIDLVNHAWALTVHSVNCPSCWEQGSRARLFCNPPPPADW